MKKIIPVIIFGILASPVQAVDVVGQSYIEKLSLGGVVSIKRAARAIYDTGERDTDVLDVAAEVLLNRYAGAGPSDVDTLAWLCRAIGSSGNDRYHNALKEIVNSGTHRKLRKYAKKALKQVGKAKSAQYVKGTVDLVALRNSAQKKSAGQEAESSVSQRSTTSTSGKESINVIRIGMVLEEVYALIGPPTATYNHATGKAYNPFNFGQKDVSREILLYKGQGRVVCTRSGYSSVIRVLEVIIDPQETGWP